MKSLSFITIFLFFATSLYAQHDYNVSVKELKTHITKLAGEDLEGRGTGQKGEKKAASYITKKVKKLKMKPLGSKGYNQDFSFELKLFDPAYPHGDAINKGILKARNVIAYVDNAAENTVIIGAHYDHLGDGTLGGSREEKPEGKIHFGADDNASGVAGLLEIARYLQTNGRIESHNYLFVFFSGEEEGLFGSKFFAENPTLSLESVNYMINLDMVGRLDSASRKLVIHGVGTSPEFGKSLNKANTERLNLVFDSSGVGPSDFTSFYLKGIPVMGFFTGQHNDYHKSSDKPEKINYSGEKDVLEFIIRVINHLDTMPKVDFTKTRDGQQTRTRFKVTLGIMPDYTYTQGGLRVDGVTEGKPAANAGIVAGDIIIRIGEQEIVDMKSYMEVLSKLEPGTKTTVTVKRAENVLTLDVTF